MSKVNFIPGQWAQGYIMHQQRILLLAEKPLLDEYPGAAAAYSLRKLRTAYTGAAIRVRESATNTEADIGFNADGTLNTTALLAHVGANNGFVTTWYDQSGNARNATQAVLINQPQIVSSGSVILENGKAALEFDGVDDKLVNAIYTQVGAAALSAFVISQSTPSDNGMSIDFGYDGLSSGAIIGINRYRVLPPLDYVAAGFEARYDATSNYINGARGGSSTSVQLLTTAITDGTDNIAFSQGIEVGRVGITTPYDFGSGIEIGALNLAGLYSDGIFQEIIIYNSDQSANRTAIENNINAFYNIY